MKKLFCLISLLAGAIAAFAQSPAEIVSRMEAEMKKHQKEGLVMTVDSKLPVIGTVSMKSWTLGEKMRNEAEMMGLKVITWADATTVWTYTPKTNKLKIDNFSTGSSSSSTEADDDLFFGLKEGYDLSISKETADAWHIQCKKSKANKDKDAPKTINLVVLKKNYYPKSLSTKASGISLTMRDISLGVNEKFVTFNPDDYPDAEVEDVRNKKAK